MRYNESFKFESGRRHAFQNTQCQSHFPESVVLNISATSCDQSAFLTTSETFAYLSATVNLVHAVWHCIKQLGASFAFAKRVNSLFETLR